MSIKALFLVIECLKVSSFQHPKFLAECFIIYVCCLLFYAIGGNIIFV